MFIWDEPLREDERARIRGAIPSWMKSSGPAYIGGLLGRLGPQDIVRLFELLGEDGGLTPTEARPWLEPPKRFWSEVESILFMVLDRCEMNGGALPSHLLRWLDHYRDQHAVSLFEGIE